MPITPFIVYVCTWQSCSRPSSPRLSRTTDKDPWRRACFAGCSLLGPIFLKISGRSQASDTREETDSFNGSRAFAHNLCARNLSFVLGGQADERTDLAKFEH
jgi:hypothetical protein